jgi:hypothetical protein
VDKNGQICFSRYTKGVGLQSTGVFFLMFSCDALALVKKWRGWAQGKIFVPKVNLVAQFKISNSSTLRSEAAVVQ